MITFICCFLTFIWWCWCLFWVQFCLFAAIFAPNKKGNKFGPIRCQGTIALHQSPYVAPKWHHFIPFYELYIDGASIVLKALPINIINFISTHSNGNKNSMNWNFWLIVHILHSSQLSFNFSCCKVWEPAWKFLYQLLANKVFLQFSTITPPI